MPKAAAANAQSKELETIRSELKKAEVIGYDNYGLSSIEGVKSTLSTLKDYDKKYPPQFESEHIRELALKRRKG